MKNKIFYLACLGFAGGALWRSFFYINGFLILAAAIISAFLILLFSLTALKKNWGVFAAVLAFGFSLGILRFHIADAPAPAGLENLVGQKISWSGMITDEPSLRENGASLTVSARNNKDETKILLSLFKNDDYKYGDEINFTGKLEKPNNFTDQGRKFDYINYLRKDGIFYTMQNPTVNVVSSGRGNFLKRSIYYLKEKFDAALDENIPAPEKSVMGALILGERFSLNQALLKSFINTGTIHIITISGYHIALVAGWIMKIFGFLPINFAAVFGIFSVFIYVIATGGAQTAVRAGIMATLALLAKTTGRLYGSARALVAAGTIMTIINPFILAFDVSFELSFLATMAVIFLSPEIEKYFYWIKWKWIRDIFSITIAAYMFVLPFILYKTGNLSLVALPANAAILPLVPITMTFGFMAGFAGLVSKFLAFIFGKIAYALLYYEIAAVGFFSRLPFAAFSIPDFPLWLVVLVYAIFFYALFGKKLNTRFLLLIAPLVITFIAAGFLYYPSYKSNQIRKRELATLLNDIPYSQLDNRFEADTRTKSGGCAAVNGLPDHDCTPGAVFYEAIAEQICVSGYTKTVRNVSTKLRKRVYAEYGVAYPQPKGAYEVDHLIPLALGGSNDIANLFLEAAAPAPGFNEKDLVEVYLQNEVCSHRVALPVAQRQIAANWLAIYNALSPEQLAALKRKYGSR